LADFRKATNIFARPDFDGDSVQIYEPKTRRTTCTHQMNLKNPEGTGDHN
jgi:type I restriction enzyme R subunit